MHVLTLFDENNIHRGMYCNMVFMYNMSFYCSVDLTALGDRDDDI